MIPGFSRDIAASREEAKRLLDEAGIHDLKLTLMVRDIPMPHYAGADLLAESWRTIGVTTTQDGPHLGLAKGDRQRRVRRDTGFFGRLLR